MREGRMLRRVVLIGMLAWAGIAAAGPYQLRHVRSFDGGRAGGVGRASVAVIGGRLFAGAPWERCGDSCDRGYTTRVYDLASGSLERELEGVEVVASTAEHLLLGSASGVYVADPETFTVERTVTSPNAVLPELELQGAVGDDILAVGYDDRPERSGQRVVYRLSPETGAVVRRYDIPPTLEWAGVHVGARLRAVAHGSVVAIRALTPYWFWPAGLFALDADDGTLRWSKVVPQGTVAVTDRHVLYALAPNVQRASGVLLAFDVATGEVADVLPGPFGDVLAARDGLVAIGDPVYGTFAGRVLVFAEAGWRLVDVLDSGYGAPFGESIALTDAILATAGNDGDSTFHVFVRQPMTTTSTTSSTTTTSTTLPPCAGGCDDGNPCTVDACVAGTCTSTALPGAAGLACGFEQLHAAVSCAPRRHARKLRARLDRMIELASGLDDGARVPRAIRRLRRRQRGYCQRVQALADAAKLEPSCAATLAGACNLDAEPASMR